jgi:hypothetical protein
MGGGIAQAYTTMGFCTFMKTVEVTRHKAGGDVSTWKVAGDIFKREGIRGINKGKLSSHTLLCFLIYHV